MMPLKTFFVLALLGHASFGAIQLPKVFKNGMVLQQEPLQANIFGTTDDAANGITVDIQCPGYQEQFPALIVSIIFVFCHIT